MNATTAAAESQFVAPESSDWPAHWRVPTSTDLEHMHARHRSGLIPVHTPLLHQPVPAVPVGTAGTRHIVEQLYAAAQRQVDGGKTLMVGLAAPQIGLAARVFLFDPRESPTDPWPPVDDLRCLINPTVEPLGHTVVTDSEGCLTTGPIRGWVPRAARVRARGYTTTGEHVDEEHTGLAARVLQHEADHLDGILLPQRIAADDDLLWASAEQTDEYLDYVRACRAGEQPSWSSRLPRDQWDAIRAGVPILGHFTAGQLLASDPE